LDFGLREDFQIYPQPAVNPAIPLTGQFPNRYQRWSPRVGFAYAPLSKTVVRGGLGMFYEILNGINYEDSVISNGLPSQQSSAFVPFNSSLAPNQQAPVFPGRIGGAGLFAASSNVSIVSPDFQNAIHPAGQLSNRTRDPDEHDPDGGNHVDTRGSPHRVERIRSEFTPPCRYHAVHRLSGRSRFDALRRTHLDRSQLRQWTS